MLVEDWRPKLYCNNVECQNISPNGKVFFIEEGHKYYHEDDVKEGKIVPFNKSRFQFKSPTGILGAFKEYFDTEKQAKKYVKKHNLDLTWEQQANEWSEKGRKASEEGTILHAYSESLWNGWDMERPDFIKAKLVEEMYETLNGMFKLAKTELLVYSIALRLAGQVDLLLKNEDSSQYSLMDYKFLKKPLEKKSFYNYSTKKYKMMSGPFRFLHDCNYNHYSIQMEIYRYLMGEFGKKVTNKTLIVVTPEEVMYEEGKDIRVWVDKQGVFHARYPKWDGKIYDSSKDPVYLKQRYKLI